MHLLHLCSHWIMTPPANTNHYSTIKICPFSSHKSSSTSSFIGDNTPQETSNQEDGIVQITWPCHYCKINQHDLSIIISGKNAPFPIMPWTPMTTIDTMQGVHINMVRFHHTQLVHFECCGFSWHISRYSKFLLHLNLLNPHKLLEKWVQLVEEHDTRICCQKSLGPSLCFKGSL